MASDSPLKELTQMKYTIFAGFTLVRGRVGRSTLITDDYELEHNEAGKLTKFPIQNISYSKRIPHYQFINQGNFFTLNCVENMEWNKLYCLR